MNAHGARTHAVQVGLRRGWTEFRLSLRSPQDQIFYLFQALVVLGYVWFNRNDVVAGYGGLTPTFALPSLLAGLVTFGLVIGPAYQLAREREDGTLLRMKAVPHGLLGYAAGQLLFHSLGLVPALVTVLVPSALLFDDVMPGGAGGWLATTGFLALGLVAIMPIGIVIGSLAPNVQRVGTWGMAPVIALVAISGLLFPVDRLWGWLQGVAQLFPMYWLGLGLRSAFLPDGAAAAELGGNWRTGQAVAVLVAWAVAGAVVAPAVLRRMARGQTGAVVAQAREMAAQWVR